MSVAVGDQYLERLEAALVGPARAKRELLAEAGDHLEDATEAYSAAGYDEETARAKALADFGSVDEIAPAFQSTLAVASSRRTAWTLLAALGIQPFLWDSGLNLAGKSDAQARSDSWLAAFLDSTIEVGGGLILLTTVLALVATGIGNRWFRAGRQIARSTAVFTLAAAVFVPATCVTMTAATGTATPAMYLLMSVLMIAPLSAAGLSARRTLQAC